MKKILKNGLIIIILAGSSVSVYGSRLHQEDGIYPNHSAEYVRTLNRNASTDADAAFYNPAGLAFMKQNGLHIMFSSQTYYKKRYHSLDYNNIEVPAMGINQATYNSGAGFYTNMPTGGIDSDNCYTAETTAPILPDLDIVYKAETFGFNWAAYFDLSVTQAAPGFTFGDGLAVVDFGNLATAESYAAMTGLSMTRYTRSYSVAKRTEYFISGTVGCSIAILDWLSTALGVRYINISGNQSIQVRGVSITAEPALQAVIDPYISDWDIDVDYKGHGVGIITGFDFKPFESLNIGLRYEYYLDAKVKKTTNRFLAPTPVEQTGQLDIFKDGTPSDEMTYAAPSGNGESSYKMTYPQSISIGISYQLLKSLRFEAGADIYLRPLVDMGGREKDFNIGYRFGGCVEWNLFFMEDVSISAGYSFYDPGIKDDKRSEVDPLLRTHTVGAGLGIQVNEQLTFSVGAYYIFYIPETVVEVMNTNISGDIYHALVKELDEESFSVAIGLTYSFTGFTKGASKK